MTGDAPTTADAPAVWTIVVAAGSGQRFGGRKQYADLGSERVLDRSLRTALSVSDGCVVVLPGDATDAELTALSTAATPAATVMTVRGGATRADSVRAGLAAVPADVGVICVHDAARPLASPALFEGVRAAVTAGADGAIPGIPVADTIKLVDAALPASPAPPGASVAVESTLPRERLVAVQTPQAFAAAALRAAHAAGDDATDDAALVERAGGRVVVVAGEAHNRKLTTADDLAWARAWIAAHDSAPVPTRSGHRGPEATRSDDRHVPARDVPASDGAVTR